VKGVIVVLRRGIAARRARTLVVVLAVAAAVAFLASTYVLTDTIDAGVASTATQASGRATAIVTDASNVDDSLLGGVPTLPAGLAARVRQVPGVSAAQGIAVGYAMPLDSQGQALSSSPGSSLGISVLTDPGLRVLALHSGHWPQGAGQVVVDATTAARLGLKSGSALRVALPAGRRTFTVSGIAGFGSAGSLAGVTIVGFAPNVAAGLLGTGGKYAAVEVASGAGTPARQLAARIRAAIGSRYTVRTTAQQAGHIVSVITGVTNVIGTLLRAFAIIALLVAALLIANTFAITVAQRARELALLRCVGASRGQTAWLVLWEAAVIGLLGGAAGIAGGIGLAVALRDILGSIGLPLPSAAPVVRAHTIVVSLAVGVGVTMASACAAAWRASRSRPLTALTSSTLTGTEPVATARRTGWVRRITAGLAAIFAAFGLTAGGRGPVALGALLLLAGVGLAGPMLVRPLTAPARGLQSALGGVSGRLAGRQMLRNPRRAAGTAGTLAVAVATVTVIAAIAATVTSSGALGVSRSLRAGYIITTAPHAGLSPTLTSRIAALPGVTGVAGTRCGVFSPPGGRETVCEIDPASYARFAEVGVTSGRLSDLAAGPIAISSDVAQGNGWRVGQRIPFGFPVGGTQRDRIVAIYQYDQVAGDFLIAPAAYAHAFPPAQQTDQTILVDTAGGAQQRVHTELGTLLTGYPQATLADKAEYASSVSSGINLVATLMTALLALSLLIGLIAVITALALSVLERTREIGLLRAVGAEIRQVRAIIRAEALGTVVTGVLTGLILGLVIGWPLALALKGGTLGSPGLPVPLLAAALPSAVVAGLLAAALPARRAARLDILTALHTE
jgi:putative ABC transport system permease protein